MRVRFFAIPALDPGEAEAELNRFLSAHRVVGLERELVQRETAPTWAVCVTWTGAAEGAGEGGRKPKATRVDYREELSVEDFAVYATLRALRKDVAERDGVPPYAVFTNEQLAAMVTGRVEDLAGLAALPGVGPSRVERHGEAFVDALKAAWGRG